MKLSGLPGRGTLCGYEYKSHIAVDSTLLLSALGVSSIYYTFWLSRERQPPAHLPRSLSPGKGYLMEDSKITSLFQDTIPALMICIYSPPWL